MKKVAGCFLAVALLAGAMFVGPLVFFNEDPPPDRDLSYPLLHLRFHSLSEVFVDASPNVTIADLFDLSVFDGFWPGITAEQAQKIAGPPQRIYQQYNGRDTVYVFSQKNGVIEVFSQWVDSEGFQGLNWFLRWRPVDRQPSAYLGPAVLKLLPDLPETVSINVRSKDGAVDVELEKGLLAEVIWIRRGPEPEIPRYPGET